MTKNQLREIIKNNYGVNARLNINPVYCVPKGMYYKYSVVHSATNQPFIYSNTLKGLYNQITK